MSEGVRSDLRIAMCVHAFKDIDFRVYFNHAWCFAHWGKKYDMVFCGKKGLDAASARNALVERALEQNCTHMFFMDADHLFPGEALDCLLDTMEDPKAPPNVAIVSGLVCKRGENFQQVVFQKQGDAYLPATLPLDGRSYQVHVCAFGCTLVSMHHLKKLQKPYFRDECRPDGQGELYNFRSDINICERFNAIGETCFVDTRVLIGHHGIDREVYPQNADLWAQTEAIMRSSAKLKQGQEGFFYECD